MSYLLFLCTGYRIKLLPLVYYAAGFHAACQIAKIRCIIVHNAKLKLASNHIKYADSLL